MRSPTMHVKMVKHETVVSQSRRHIVYLYCTYCIFFYLTMKYAKISEVMFKYNISVKINAVAFS